MREKEEIRYRYFCILSSLISAADIPDKEKLKINYALMKLEDYLF